jgi:hypothetical protein
MRQPLSSRIGQGLALAALAIFPALKAQAGDYQTKTPYPAAQVPRHYAAPPAGYEPVFTQLVARHGSRGLSGLKSELALYRLWEQAQAEQALTPLGRQLGPELMHLIEVNALLGAGVPGIQRPGYGNESQLGITEHSELATRMLRRLPQLFQHLKPSGSEQPRQIVVQSSGVDRAVDSATFFITSLMSQAPDLISLVTYPPALPINTAQGASQQPDGVDRHRLYFHKLSPRNDTPADPNSPLLRTIDASLAYQAYLAHDADLQAQLDRWQAQPEMAQASDTVLRRLFTPGFVAQLQAGTRQASNTGTLRFQTRDGTFSTTLTGDGRSTLRTPVDVAQALYEVYAIAPGLHAELRGMDFQRYMPAAAAHVFAQFADDEDFASKGPGLHGKDGVTHRMARALVQDMFDEVDAIARGDLRHAAKLRFAHAEIIIPLASALALPHADQPLPVQTSLHAWHTGWRGQDIAPMAANIQWDVFRHRDGRLIVRQLYNEQLSDFKAACASAQLPGAPHFYDYAALRTCYGQP